MHGSESREEEVGIPALAITPRFQFGEMMHLSVNVFHVLG